MVLPAGVLTGLGELATNAKVQEFATNLVKNVYGKIMPSRSADPVDATEMARKVTLDDLDAKVGNIPTREEITAAFSLLQAEMDRRHSITTRIVYAILAAQLVTLAMLLVIWAR